ncbi:MAG: hypothetical protein QNJ45_05115 [Ardenticatenaceae bacterium]|nr:hypothetical protein [Ardenticatenaceae bacterium]
MEKKYLTKWQIAAAAVVIVVTLVTRFWLLEERVHTLWVDEAWFSLRGLDVLSRADLIPLEKPDLGVGDSLFQIYAAAAMSLIGAPEPFSSRYASAVAGSVLVGIFAFFWIRLWRPQLGREPAVWAGIIGSFILATTFTTILHSRHGLQMSASVALSLLVFWFLWRSFFYFKTRDAVLVGLALAISFTTYEAALALPIVVTAFGAVRWWSAREERSQKRRILRQMGIMIGSTVLFFTPLIIFYANNPGIFLGHVVQTQAMVSEQSVTFTDRLTDLIFSAANGIWVVFNSFFFVGDGALGRNIPGRHLFDWFVAIWIVIGAGWVVRTQWRRAEGQLVGIWFGVMILPAALSNTLPAFSRMLPVVPLLAGLGGIGVVKTYRWVRQRQPGLLKAGIPLLLAGFIFSAASSWRDYHSWTQDPALFDKFYQGARYTADQAIALAAESENLVLVTNQSGAFTRYPFELLLDPVGITTFDVNPTCFPHPAKGEKTVWYGVIHNLDSVTPQILRQEYGESILDNSQVILHPLYGDEFASFYPLSAADHFVLPQNEFQATFEDQILLAGYDLSVKNNQLNLKTYWQGSGALPFEALLFIHIGEGDNSDPLFAQANSVLCPGFTTPVWQPGLMMVHEMEIPLPADHDLSAADIRLGLIHPQTGDRLTVTSSMGRIENNRLILAPFPDS